MSEYIESTSVNCKEGDKSHAKQMSPPQTQSHLQYCRKDNSPYYYAHRLPKSGFGTLYIEYVLGLLLGPNNDPISNIDLKKKFEQLVFLF